MPYPDKTPRRGKKLWAIMRTNWSSLFTRCATIQCGRKPLNIYPHTLMRSTYPEAGLNTRPLLIWRICRSEFTCNIRIAEDILSFDAVTNCSIALIEETEWNCGNSDIIQWLTISCEAKITDRLECLKITNICPYQRGYRKTAKGTFSSNIIPYIKKEDLEQEAEVFLKQYCPEALERPMCVPISAIAESMGLTIIQGRCLTDDFSIFGEICFSAGNIELFDLFKCSKSTVEVSRGTILIDRIYVLGTQSWMCQ